MRTVRAVGYGLALLAASAGTASAQNAGGINFAELFQQLDANGDMVIDRGEVPASGLAAFETLVKNGDTNKDGKIDREEYRALVTSLRDSFGSLTSRFAEVDRNSDGKIGKDEFRGPEPLFARIDADGDGFITRDEAAKFQPAQGAGAGAGMIAGRILSMDKNNDGKVSRDEFTGIPANFDRWDANKDGFISRDEIPGGAAAAVGPAKGAGAADKPEATKPAPDPAAGTGNGERFRAMDKDGDGKISKDEFPGPAQFFERLDANSDGFVTMQEVARMAREAASPGAPGSGQGAIGDRLQAMDKNKDGKISKDEYTGPAQFFDRLDANSDGFISSDELPRRRLDPGKAQGKRRRPDANKV
jgi:Ca2+-binding EF-hand superfamily protein